MANIKKTHREQPKAIKHEEKTRKKNQKKQMKEN